MSERERKRERERERRQHQCSLMFSAINFILTKENIN
jgi:hypothetical protein